jgi:hypothetical protein
MIERQTDIITAMLAPLMFFEGRCKDKKTLRKLIALAKIDPAARRPTGYFLKLGRRR